MKLKKLVPIFALAAAATLAGCGGAPSNTSSAPPVVPPEATQTYVAPAQTHTAPAPAPVHKAPEHKSGFSYGVHTGPHYNMSSGKIEFFSVGPGIDF